MSERICVCPQVNFRETIRRKASFDYLHKKQSGGQGQYGRVTGFIEPISPEELQASGDGESENKDTLEFVNEIVGTAIPPQFIPAVEKGKCNHGWVMSTRGIACDIGLEYNWTAQDFAKPPTLASSSATPSSACVLCCRTGLLIKSTLRSWRSNWRRHTL